MTALTTCVYPSVSKYVNTVGGVYRGEFLSSVGDGTFGFLHTRM